MENEFTIDPKQREMIYEFRKRRRDKEKDSNTLKNDPKKVERDKKVDLMMRSLLPSFYKYKDAMEEAADSVWFAMSEMKRMNEHMDTTHEGNADACSEECLFSSLGFTVLDSQEYMETIMKSMREEISNELK